MGEESHPLLHASFQSNLSDPDRFMELIRNNSKEAAGGAILSLDGILETYPGKQPPLTPFKPPIKIKIHTKHRKAFYGNSIKMLKIRQARLPTHFREKKKHL